jgi:hypothetical protein
MSQIVEFLKSMDAQEGRSYLVMVPHGWARDSNAHKAFKEAKRHMAYAPDRPTAVVFDTADDAWVNGMGGVCSDSGPSVKVGQFTFKNPR